MVKYTTSNAFNVTFARQTLSKTIRINQRFVTNLDKIFRFHLMAIGGIHITQSVLKCHTASNVIAAYDLHTHM